MALPTMVTAKSGKQYSSDSPQGQVIIQARERAAASVAASQPFSSDSSALDSISPVINDIATDIGTINENVNSLVMIAQADARGDILGAADVVPEGGTGTDANGVPIGGLGGGADDPEGNLAGLGGMAGFIGGLGKGLTMWGAAGPGVLVFTGFLALMTAVVYAGAVSFRKSAPEIAEGMEVLSDADVDTDKVIQMGKALAAFGAAMGVSGVGTAVSSLGTLVAGISDAFGGLLGIEGKDPMVLMREFSKHEFTEDEVKQIELNARALTAFSGAMAIEGTTSAVGSIAGLIGGVADGLRSLIPVEEKDPMLEMRRFANHIFTDKDVAQIKLNAAALLGFQTAMSATKTIDIVESVADLITGIADGLRSLIPVEAKDPMLEMRAFADHKFTAADVKQIGLNAGALIAWQTAMSTAKTIDVVESVADLITGVADGLRSLIPVDARDPMLEMRKFADHKFTEADAKQIGLNAKALLAFSSTMAVESGLSMTESVFDLIGGFARGIGKLFGLPDAPDPMLQMKDFAKHKFTQADVDQVSLNAEALVNFSKAMALYSASGATSSALDLVGNMATGIVNFFGGTTGIDYEEIKTFAASDIGTLEPKITANANALAAFANAMKIHAKDDVKVEWTNLGANVLGAVSSFFGGSAEENLLSQFDAINKFTEKELNLARVDNNIQAINKFMEFGQSWVGFQGGDFDAVGDFAEALVRSANGIHTAMYGGEYAKSGINMKIDAGKGLAAVDFMDMSEASMGIAVLRHSLTSNAPLQELKDVSAQMNTSAGGGTTIIDASDKSVNTSNRSGDQYLQDLSGDHNESTLQMMFMQSQGMVLLD